MPAHDIVFRFEHEIRSAVENAGLVGKRLVIAVSGGPDSLAMLYALHRVKDDLNATLHVGHLDHQLRGDDSAADAEFVAETTEKLGVACTVETADVLGFQKEHRLSLEAAAREVRYGFLARLTKQVGAHAIALGHTSDDQVETVLMHIIRGSGLQGLRGIQQVSQRRIDEADVTLFRPILNLSKQDTVDYCRALDLEARLDESNLSVKFTRNKVRHELVPLLEEVNPAFKEALLRLSRNADDAVTIVDRAVDAAWSDVATLGKDRVVFDRSKFRELDKGTQAHVVMRALSLIRGTGEGVERVHVEDAVDLITGSAGTELHLPNGVRLSIEGGSAVLSGKDRTRNAVPLPILEASTLRVPGTTVVDGWKITADFVSGPPVTSTAEKLSFAPDGLVARFGKGLDIFKLTLRGREAGDRFQSLGMSGTKKLKDFFIDEKIPSGWRDRVPLVVSSQGIAWVVGWRIADWAKVGPDDEECLEIKFEKAE
jgi:tRNA(Ile)-lysidine synthase